MLHFLVGRVIDDVLDYLADGEVVEGWYEQAEIAAKDPQVVASFARALKTLADKVPFWMADKKVATHTITVGSPE